MAIKYYKLLDMLNRKGMNKTDLKKAIGTSTATITKISKNENISLKIINDICSVLDCQPSDLMEYVREENDMKSLEK